MFRSISVAIIFVMSFTALGCGPQVKGLQRDPTFTHANVLSGRLAVGGVTSLVHRSEDAALRSRLSSMLRIQLIEHKFKVDPTGTLESALGARTYHDTLDRFRDTGIVDDATLALWSTAVTPRYMVFARIEDDATTTSQSDGTETVDKTEYGYRKLTTKRTVSTSFQIYDLTTRTSVWSAVLTDDASATNKYSTGELSEAKKTKLLDVIADVLISALDEQTYPEAPNLDDVVESIFGGFADKMPDTDK